DLLNCLLLVIIMSSHIRLGRKFELAVRSVLWYTSTLRRAEFMIGRRTTSRIVLPSAVVFVISLIRHDCSAANIWRRPVRGHRTQSISRKVSWCCLPPKSYQVYMIGI